MNQFLISERLKLRHTFLQKLCFLCPLITGIIAFVLASNYVQIDSYNWWYTIILPGMISLMCALGAGIDKKMNDRSVLSLPVPLERVFLAKIWIMAEQLIISCVLIFLFSVFSVLFLKEGSYIAISWERMLGGSVILILCFLWQIPLCLFLGYKIGLFPTLLVNFACNLVFSITLSISSWWFLVPYAYPARLICPILKVLPNGLPAEPGNMTFTPELVSYHVILPGIVISLVLFVAGTILVCRWYGKREGK